MTLSISQENNISRLVQSLVLMLAGVLVARLFGWHDLQDSDVYLHAVTLLLAIGLYGSTYGIDLTEARQHLRLIVMAVTVGVVCKAVIIGGLLWWMFDDPRYVIIGVALAQIDPLSVAALSQGSRLSRKAKSILGAWASFDDPVTTLLTLYATTVVVRYLDVGSFAPGAVATGSWASYLADLGLNIALVGFAVVGWRVVHSTRFAKYGLLAVVTTVATERFLMLGQAVSGLFVRPYLNGFLTRLIDIALILAGFMLGLVLADGVNIGHGIALGAATFLAQIVVGAFLTRGLSRPDRVHLAFAQQNGITAIILALLLEAQFDGVVAVVAPAIITVNLIHLLVNALVDRRMPSRIPIF